MSIYFANYFYCHNLNILINMHYIVSSSTEWKTWSEKFDKRPSAKRRSKEEEGNTMIFTGNHGRRRAQNNGQNSSQNRRRSSNIDVRKKKMMMTERQCHNLLLFHDSYLFRVVVRPQHHQDCQEKIHVNLQATALICIPIPHHHHLVHLTITHCREQAVVQHTWQFQNWMNRNMTFISKKQEREI